MTKKHALLTSIIVISVVGLLAATAIHFLTDVGPDEPTGPDDQPVAPVGAAPETNTPLAAVEMSDARKQRAHHSDPWPFGDFADDISSLLRPGRIEVMRARDKIETDFFKIIVENKVSLRLDNVRVGDVVKALAREYEPLEVTIYEGLPKVSDRVVFKRVYLTDVTVQQVVAFMALQSDEQVFSAMTPKGFCIGSKNACIQARLDAKEWEADFRAGVKGEPDDFLDVDYRPDMRGADVGRLITDIRAKTGIDVVIGPRAWEKGLLFTWTSDPLPLRDALDEIARRLGGRVYVRSGRAFILIG